jgi:hypothetical protein
VREWPWDSVSQNGQLGSGSPRQVFTMHVPADLPVKAKRRFIRSVNAAVARAYHGLFILFLEYLVPLRE